MHALLSTTNAKMWKVVTIRSIQIMKVNIDVALEPDAPTYIPKRRVKWRSEDKKRNNLNNITREWDKLMKISEDCKQEKDKKKIGYYNISFLFLYYSLSKTYFY